MSTGTASPTLASVSTQDPNHFKSTVAIGWSQTYDRAVIESQMQTLIDQLGGLSDVIKPGDSVAIKPNLTGGTASQRVPGYKPEDSIVTPSAVVRALVKQVKAAGAKAIFIVEAVGEVLLSFWRSWKGFKGCAPALEARQ